MISDLDYAGLSASVYTAGAAPPGWSVVATSSNSADGFFAEAFSNGTETVIAYRGSTEPQDFYNVGVLGAGLNADQLQDATGFYNYVTGLNQTAGQTISTTGHSLGGALASAVAYINGLSATTFDSTASIAAAARYLWQNATPDQQQVGEAQFESAAADAMRGDLSLKDLHVSGEVASAIFSSSDIGGFIAGSTLLPHLDSSHSLYTGTWTGGYDYSAFVSDSLNFSINLHNMNLAYLAEEAGPVLDAAIGDDPYFIRQMLNEDNLNAEGTSTDLFLNHLATQDAASVQAGVPSALDALADDARIGGEAALDAGTTTSPDAMLATGLMALSVSWAAEQLAGSQEGDGFLAESVNDGSTTSILVFSPQDLGSPSNSPGFGLVDDWLSHDIDSMGFQGVTKPSIGQFENVEIVSPNASGYVSPVLDGSGPELLVGNLHSGTLIGGAGDDLIVSPSALVTINAGGGDDDIYVAGIGHSSVDGGSGDDVVYISDPSAITLTYDGGAGTDALSFDKSAAGVNVDLSSAGPFALSNVEQVVGSNHGDVFTLSGSLDLLTGSGSNTIYASGDGSDATKITLGGGVDNVFSSATGEQGGIALDVESRSTGVAHVAMTSLPTGTDASNPDATVDVIGVDAIYAPGVSSSSAYLTATAISQIGATLAEQFGYERPDETYVGTGSDSRTVFKGEIDLHLGQETIDLGQGFYTVITGAQGTEFNGMVPVTNGEYIMDYGLDPSGQVDAHEYSAWVDNLQLHLSDGDYSLYGLSLV